MQPTQSSGCAQRILQLLGRRAQGRIGQPCQLRDIRLSQPECLQDATAADPQQIADPTRQLEAGILQEGFDLIVEADPVARS